MSIRKYPENFIGLYITAVPKITPFLSPVNYPLVYVSVYTP